MEKLTRELEERKQELIQSEEKYDRCIAKARTVLANLNDGSSEAALRHEISEKDQLISKLERDVAQMRSQYDSQVELTMLEVPLLRTFVLFDLRMKNDKFRSIKRLRFAIFVKQDEISFFFLILCYSKLLHYFTNF